MDHTEYIHSQCSQMGGYIAYFYRSVWRLDIEVTEPEDSWWPKRELHMSFYRVSTPSSWDLRLYFDKEKTAA